MLGQKALYVFHPDDIQAVMQREGKWPIGGASSVWPFVAVIEKLQIANVAFVQVNILIQFSARSNP